MNNPKVTIGIIVSPGCEKYLSCSLTSAVNQDYKALEVLIKDHSPEGKISKWIKKELPEVFKKVKILKGENRWHSGGHNDLMNAMSGNLYICASNDMLYPQNLASEIANAYRKNPDVGSLTCKLMQWDFKKAQKGDLEGSKSNRIDSMGIAMRKTHHFYDLGQGEEDCGQYDKNPKIVGPTGALAAFTPKGLKAIAYKNKKGKTEYFDELIHYKNDVDLAYRLCWAGQKCLSLPQLKVYHDRQLSADEEIIKSRRGRKKWKKENSFFGDLIVMQKNFHKGFSWSVKIQTWMYRAAKFIFITLFEHHLLKQYGEVKKHKSEIEAKKRAMQCHNKPCEIEKLMQ